MSQEQVFPRFETLHGGGCAIGSGDSGKHCTECPFFMTMVFMDEKVFEYDCLLRIAAMKYVEDKMAGLFAERA